MRVARERGLAAALDLGECSRASLFRWQAAYEHGVEPRVLVDIGLATAAALAHLHEIGLVFRDFKPANTLRTPDGRYRLIDFGIAYAYRDGQGEPLSTGTPPFYSRAQYEGHPPCPADDIFAALPDANWKELTGEFFLTV